MSGTQIWMGRKPCWRKRRRCARTLLREDLERLRAPIAASIRLHVTMVAQLWKIQKDFAHSGGVVEAGLKPGSYRESSEEGGRHEQREASPGREATPRAALPFG